MHVEILDVDEEIPNRTALVTYLSCDDVNVSIVCLDGDHVLLRETSISRLRHLPVPWEIDPELEPHHCPLVRLRHLLMDDP